MARINPCTVPTGVWVLDLDRRTRRLSTKATIERRLSSDDEPGEVRERVDEEDGPAPHPDAAEHVGRVVPPENQHRHADACDH
jgi:hypothetical protein